jgi:multiple sugar transport system substrate-binding protein
MFSGKVTYAIEDIFEANELATVAEFNKIYPNIEVEVVKYPMFGRNDYLTAQAAAQSMPDVVTSLYYEIPFDISQGWLYPVNEFVEKDDEWQYVNRSIYETYIYNDRLYALPKNIGFEAMVLNLTLLESLNEDIPAYDEWTIDEFVRLVKKATTNTTSGIKAVGNLDFWLPAQMNNDLRRGSYNESTHRVDLSGGEWVDAVNLIKELKAVPGLIADELINQAIRNEGGQDDYEKKFGKNADAVMDGKVLIKLDGTWNYMITKQYTFDFDYYTIPFDPELGFRTQAHVDTAMMLATAEHPEAAFELLKFITYGKDGVLARLNIMQQIVDASGNPAPEFFIPSTNHPEVVETFENISYIPKGVIYMYKNMDKAVRGDLYRYIPNFNPSIKPLQGEERQQIYDGVVEGAAVAAEIEQKVNKSLKESYDKFVASLPEIEAEFEKLRSK